MIMAANALAERLLHFEHRAYDEPSKFLIAMANSWIFELSIVIPIFFLQEEKKTIKYVLAIV